MSRTELRATQLNKEVVESSTRTALQNRGRYDVQKYGTTNAALGSRKGEDGGAVQSVLAIHFMSPVVRPFFYCNDRYI
jgi:hypothetical protein